MTSIRHTAKPRVSRELDENMTRLQVTFDRCADVVFRMTEGVPAEHGYCLVYISGIVDTARLGEEVLRPLLAAAGSGEAAADLAPLITSAELSRTSDYGSVVDAILGGRAAVFCQGQEEALLISTGGGTRRSVQEPATEAVVRGPREGFTEDIHVNTALIRFKIKSPDLKLEAFTLGEQTRTGVMLAYLEGTADPEVIREVKRRLEHIRIDGILESGYIEEFIEDEAFSPFPQLHYTERPDTAAAQLLEGRFAVFVDGTPFVLMAPVTFWEMLQASEDYYERYFIGTLLRWLRLGFLFFALFLPGIYVSVTTYHQDMLPTNLLLSIAAARESIPFPALIETLIMEVAFEALREAGIRLPKTLGQAVSILGALVIGQAAVQAGIVSAPIVIIVSLTGIASFTIPRFNAAISIRILRFPIMIMGGLFGLFGMVIATLWLAVHLCQLRSFGVPYLSGMAPYQKGELGDILVRVPWWRMSRRPLSITGLNRKRMPAGQRPAPPPHSRSKG
ncbi:GerA family spore germination protein [Paenibacillus mucilaginosus 3016]|uniref:GerA family spore germination protein n=1 Tax=Paenibacillus mucilaginosus 3016 TaxID=1116391 RepID=H6NLX5_9BACL|nr:spore germination protein [Paenibacillus mucilaginosus]AFC31690.1 GerA family spore germination protein [Paenibacillus mucilaginosus 3016]WFA20220.1 spore germination protein [Paenibacillus mucilaginosus]